jgi:hypothetical protein
MLTRGGADRIDGAAPDRASGPTPPPALGSGGAEHGILTPGIQVGMPTGTPIRSVTGANGTAADAPRAALTIRLPSAVTQRLAILDHLHHIGNRPQLISHASGHRRNQAARGGGGVLIWNPRLKVGRGVSAR